MGKKKKKMHATQNNTSNNYNSFTPAIPQEEVTEHEVHSENRASNGDMNRNEQNESSCKNGY